MKCLLPLIIASIASCSHIRVTKTGMGIYPPTNPGAIEIRATVPQDRPYDEIAMVSANLFGTDPAQAYNQIRVKAAQVGADAVVLTNQTPIGRRTIISGAAIKYRPKSQ